MVIEIEGWGREAETIHKEVSFRNCRGLVFIYQRVPTGIISKNESHIL